MDFRPELPDLLTDLQQAQTANHVRTDHERDHKRGEHAQDGAQRDVMIHVEAAVAVREPLCEIEQNEAHSSPERGERSLFLLSNYAATTFSICARLEPFT